MKSRKELEQRFGKILVNGGAGFLTYCFSNNTYVILFFLLGFSWILPFQARTICLTLIILFYCVDHIVFKQYYINKIFIVFLVFFLITLTHLAVMNLYELIRFGYIPFHDIYTSPGRDILKLTLVVAWMYVAVNILGKYIHNGLLISSFTNGFNVFVIVLLCFLPSVIGDGVRLAMTFQESEDPMHPNRVAYVMLLFFYLNLLSSFYANKVLVKIYHWFFCILNFAFIVMTLSRTSLAVLLVGLTCLLFFRKKILCVLLLGAMAFGLYIVTFDENFFLNLPINERFTARRAIEDGGSGRDRVWMDYLTHASLKHYLIGIGYDSPTQGILYQKPLRHWVARDRFLGIYSPHNTYLNNLLTFGIIGFIIYLYFLYFLGKKIIINAMSNTGTPRIYFAMFVSFVIWGLFENPDFTSIMFISIFLSQIIQLDNFFLKDGIDETRIDCA